MRNRAGIWVEFAGDEARVCREVMAGDGVAHAAERFTMWGVPCSGGWRFHALSGPGLFFVYAVHLLSTYSVHIHPFR